MGQYYIAVNLDKKEFIHPHRCNDGMKLLEFGLSSMGTMSCLAILLADGNGRGGGDLMGPKCKGPCKGRGWITKGKGPGNLKPCKKCGGSGHADPPAIVGSWAGDRIVIAGDYADDGKFLTDDMMERFRLERALHEATGHGEREEVREGLPNLLSYVCREGSEFKDVSLETMRALAHDYCVREQLEEQAKRSERAAEKVAPILEGLGE